MAYGYLQQRPGDAHSIVLSGAGAVVNTIMGRGTGHRESVENLHVQLRALLTDLDLVKK